ncbi:MAG TPA: polyprenyl synthetase family protein [Solirubrobacteraceae bacterium]|jgi:geranylgeranyl diphosphate synthase type I
MGAAAAPRSSAEVLSWGRDALQPALRAAIDTLPSGVRHVAEFHLGWCDEHGLPTPGAGGKAIRPTLTLLTARAIGGAYEPALPAAVAVELVHDFSLLHDDVMDGDVRRRHRPTAWSAFGVGQAILAGDSLLALAFGTLAASGAGSAQAAAGRILSATVQALIDGQSSDLAFEARDEVSLPECMDMARAKTGMLLGCACELGALFAAGDRDQVAHAREFGERLGLAFQLVDDILGIWGDPAVTGKAIHADISARKKSLPVVAALVSQTPAGRDLADLYGRGDPLSSVDVALAAELVTESGGRAWTEAEAARQVSGALAALRSAGASGAPAAELESLARLVTTRDR